ncbi:hypothetical protein G6F68_020293 [Rhizopus microsporus]|nr:hypothetical protein G6F68_020293 [Rhizopus microsporus]
MPAAQDGPAVLACLGPPCRQRGIGGRNGTRGFGLAQIRDRAQRAGVEGIAHRDGGPVVGVAPGAAGVRLLPQQLAILQIHCFALHPSFLRRPLKQAGRSH